MYKSAARTACRPAVALEFGPGLPLHRGIALPGILPGVLARLLHLQILSLDNMSSPYKPRRAGDTKYAFCPQQLQRLKYYALASRQEYKRLVVAPSLFLAACSLLALLYRLPDNGGSPDALRRRSGRHGRAAQVARQLQRLPL